MIELTKLNKKRFILNCELIESIESTPDTIVTLRNGKLVLVTETPQQIVDATIEYKRQLFNGLINVRPPRSETSGEDILE